jgi:hypothetical protein
MALKLRISPISQGIPDLLDFDGINDYILFPSVPDVSGNKRITFNAYLETLNTQDVIVIFQDSDYLGDLVAITLTSSGESMYIMARSIAVPGDPSGGWVLDISTYDNQELFFDIIKSQGKVLEVNVNGVLQSNKGNVTYGNSIETAHIGATNVPNGFFSNGFLWDFKIYDDPYGSNTLIHHWKGYPAGNTNAAWEDLVGSVDGSVMGDPDTSSIGIDSSGTPNNLRIGLFPVTYNELADLSGVASVVRFVSGGDDTFGILGRVYKWKMWMGRDSSWNNNVFSMCPSSNGNVPFRTILRDSSIYLIASGTGKSYDISGYDNGILNCEAVTGYFVNVPPLQPAPGSIIDFKIDGESIVSFSNHQTFSGDTTATEVAIGSGQIKFIGIDLSTGLGDCAVWDLSVETSLGVVVAEWAGYPEGDTLAAWVDKIGSVDAFEVQSEGTRNITGIDIENQPIGAKLKLSG